MIVHRWVSRSRVAPVSRSLQSTSVHSSNGRFVVTITLERSYARLITSNSSSAPTGLAGTYPSSSSTRGPAPPAATAAATGAAPRGPPATEWPAPSLGSTAPASHDRTPPRPRPWPGGSFQGRDHRDGAMGEGGRHGVVIGVEADQRQRAGLGRLDPVGGERLGRRGEEGGPLL